MGGALAAAGNATPVAEYNVAYDPVAARELVRAAWTSPPGLIGLDVTARATLGRRELELLRARRTPAARFLAGPIERYARVTAGPDGTFPTHDVLVPMAIAEPDLVAWTTVGLDVDVAGGAEWGRTRTGDVAAGWPRWRVAVDVDVDRFRAGVRRLLRRVTRPGSTVGGAGRATLDRPHHLVRLRDRRDLPGVLLRLALGALALLVGRVLVGLERAARRRGRVAVRSRRSGGAGGLGTTRPGTEDHRSECPTTKQRACHRRHEDGLSADVHGYLLVVASWLRPSTMRRRPSR
jgi:hypothetical protein